jgi:hypothetical protein
MLSSKFLPAAALLVAVTLGGAPVFAQTAPAASPAPSARGQHMARGMEQRKPDFARYAPMALRMAYDAIGRAQAEDGNNPAVASAKNHYTAGLARLAKSDAQGAVGEAHAAMAYAGLAMTARRQRPVPTGIAAPPAGPTRDANDGASRAYEMLARLTREQSGIAKVAAIASNDEVSRLSRDASGAQNAAERAVAAKNYAEAEKQAGLAGRLNRTLVAVVAIDHADQVRTLMPHDDMGMHGGHGHGGMMHGGPGMQGGPGGMMHGRIGDDGMAPPVIGDDMEGPPPPFAPGDAH